jgi:hypothetical protein
LKNLPSVRASFVVLLTLASSGIAADAFDQLRLRATPALDQVANVTAAGAFADRDVFGIRMLYPTRDGTRPWTSAHWAGRKHVIAERPDANDPQRLSGKRGSGTLSVADGVLTMAGAAAHLISPYDGAPWRVPSHLRTLVPSYSVCPISL